jgi:uncharacterized protein YndB with AHSA1/START domain
MTVVSTVKDADARTLVVTARFDAPVARVWQVWSDPRQLERWWGPPTYPARVLDHDLEPGGTVTYVMTGPDGGRYGGWFRVRAADPPHALELDAGFADGDGKPIPDAATSVIRVALTALPDGGTEMTITTAWDSDEAMEQALATGMDEGMTAAVGQIEALLGSADDTDRPQARRTP